MKISIGGRTVRINFSIKFDPKPPKHSYLVGNLFTLETVRSGWDIVADDTGTRYFFHAPCDSIAENGKCLLCGEER